MTIAYLNGEYLPQNKARVSAMDRGFLFAEAVYEVIPVYNGRAFWLPQHLRRLQNSLNAIELYSAELPNFAEVIEQIIKKNDGGDQLIYLQISRGEIPQRIHVVPTHFIPTVFITSKPLPRLSIDELAEGIAAITLPDIRWKYCYIKTTNLLANILLSEEARKSGAKEAILIDEQRVLEGATTSVFIVHDSIIYTPKESQQILPGITKEFVCQLAAENKLLVEEIHISIDVLRKADEIWVTSSSKEITPVVKLDNNPVGNGMAGPVWRKMIQYYHDYLDHEFN